MPAVTALREQRDGRIAIELDGVAWRVLPADAVVRSGLRVGVALDRSRARTLRRELRRAEAMATAGRALARRDLTRSELAARLERAGVTSEARDGAVAALGRAGALDDDRVAHARAATLAERGHGDAAIRWDLERRGIAPELAEGAVAALVPEPDRAATIVARRGAGPAVLRLLARRGFGEESLEAAFRETGRTDC